MATEAREALGLMRVDVTGSLLRPERLQAIAARYGRGEVDAAAFRQVQDDCIRDVIAQQEAHDLPVLTDGEFRRANFQDSFGQSVAGYDAVPPSWEARPLYDGTTPFRRIESGLGGTGAAIVHRRPVAARLQLAHNLPLAEYQFSSAL